MFLAKKHCICSVANRPHILKFEKITHIYVQRSGNIVNYFVPGFFTITCKSVKLGTKKIEPLLLLCFQTIAIFCDKVVRNDITQRTYKKYDNVAWTQIWQHFAFFSIINIRIWFWRYTKVWAMSRGECAVLVFSCQTKKHPSRKNLVCVVGRW